MSQTADVVIIGGGVIGCAAALELAKAGLKVVLLEKGDIGGGASSASAGLIVPLHATDDGQRTPRFDFYWASSALFPDLIADLEETTGIRTDYDPSGSMRIALTEDEEELLRESFEGWNSLPELAVEWVDGRTLRSMEPDLSPEVRCGVISRDEQSLHPGRYTKALARAAIRHGADIRTGCPVTGVKQQDGKFRAVRTPDGEIAAGELIVAAGAWSRLPCSWFGVHIPVAPARGQMVAVRPDARSLTRPLFSYNGAVLPRVDGTVHVGATVELVGFDARTTAEGIASVLAMIPRLAPPLNPAALERAWAGLRPWCEDGSPVIGRLPGCEGVTVASGHFKMGIVGSPITARILKTLIADNRLDPLAEPFSPERFAGNTP